MSGLNGMGNQVKRLEEKAPKPPEEHTVELNLHLFTDEEQAHISTLYGLIDNNFNHLYKLNHDQLDYFHTVALLNELDEAESEQAAEYRRHMAELSARPHFALIRARLVASFLSLDEQRIPDYAEVTKWWTQQESLPPDYPMRRAYYRQRKAWIEEVMDKSEKWRGDGLSGIGMYEAEMIRWLEAYGNLEDI